MKKSMNDSIANYKQQLANSDIRETYEFLIKYLMKIKASFEKEYPKKYTCGNVAPGYLDISYFSFFDSYLRDNKLRYGIVLNHQKMQFEFWLMGQNAEVQKIYWEKLSNTKWNEGQLVMPKYSAVETVLVKNPDFDNISALTEEIIQTADDLASEITQYIQSINNK